MDTMDSRDKIAESLSPTLGMVERASEDFMALQVDPHTKAAKLNFYMGMISAMDLFGNGTPAQDIAAFALNEMHEIGD